ncbi:MAG TPA: cation diffusion facilitator family transporter [Bacilli bacterium]
MSEEHKHHANIKTLLISFIIIGSYMIVEVVGGLLTGSLALLSDAGHMLSDALSLGIALLAFIMSNRFTGEKRTYGNKRFEILAALSNGLLLIGMAGYIFYEAAQRIKSPQEIDTGGMLIISVIGLLVNIFVALIMHRGGDIEENLNMRGAFLHVLSDMLGSIGAILAAILIMSFGWTLANPIASIVVALLVLRSGFHVTKDAVHILMEGVPDKIDIEKVLAAIRSEEKILSVHDFHLWTITSGYYALTCHAVVADEFDFREAGPLLKRIENSLRLLGINHVTIQLETAIHCEADSLYCNAE